MLLVYLLSLAQNQLLHTGSKNNDKSNLTEKWTSFNFEDVNTKINFAKAKLLVAMAFGIIYVLGSPVYWLFWYLITGKSQPSGTDNDGEVYDYSQSKSFFLFIIIAGLTQVKERFEHMIFKNSHESLSLGRALFTPLVFLCFTLFMLNKIPVFLFFLHLLFLISYAYFYLEDFKHSLGLDRDASIFDEDRALGL